MDVIPIILFFVLASMAGSALMLFVMRRAEDRQDGLQALAATQGWIYDHTPGTMRRNAVTTMRDPADDWSLRLSIGGGGSSTHRTLDWHSNSGGIPSGGASGGGGAPPDAKASGLMYFCTSWMPKPSESNFM